MKTIVNCTPHSITVVTTGGRIEIPPSGMVARVTTTRVQVGDINGIPVNAVKFGEITGLPESANDTVYIVSSLVAQAARGRNDIYIVDDTVRDAAGQIVGCRAFAQI